MVEVRRTIKIHKVMVMMYWYAESGHRLSHPEDNDRQVERSNPELNNYIYGETFNICTVVKLPVSRSFKKKLN